MSFPHYSSLFTSGLLANHTSRGRHVSSFERDIVPDSLFVRRGSLPETSSSSLSSSHLTNSVYFAAQPKSFLSLDLAEAAGRKCKTAKPLLTNPFDRSRPKTMAAVRSASSPSPSLRPSSRDSVRALPSPKPVPQATLPAVPALQAPVPRRDYRSLSPMRFAQSPPPLSPTISICPLETPASLASPVPSVSVTSQYRREERVNALARLEGRSNENFMSLSDDEDEDDCEEEKMAKGKDEKKLLVRSLLDEVALPDLSPISPSNSSFALSIPVPAAPRYSAPALWVSRVPAGRPPRTSGEYKSRGHQRQRSSTVSMAAHKASPAPASGTSLRRKFSLKDPWFGLDLVNFIDFRDDRDSRGNSWRSSIVEIPSLA